MITLSNNQFPLFSNFIPHDLKDACPVFDGKLWHIFGSGGDVRTETWAISHHTSQTSRGPWFEENLIFLDVPGSGVAAPGVIFDDGVFNMFIQTEFMKTGGDVYRVVSVDGYKWSVRGIALYSSQGTSESGIYDPHPAVIAGKKYLVYSAFPEAAKVQPDIHLAVSITGEWCGPWYRMGCIHHHAEIADHHNQKDHPDYEWGLEGSNLLELPDGRILMNSVCFLPKGDFGTRQRVYLAIADRVEGPYMSLGPIIPTPDGGENGHGTLFYNENNQLSLMYQARNHTTNFRWTYGLTEVNIT